MKYLVIICVLFFVGCKTSDGCKKNTTRCNGEVVEVCNDEGDWELSVDCEEVSKDIQLNFECGIDEDGLHSCLLVGKKDGGVDAGI